MIRGGDSPEILSWKVRGSLRKKEKLVKESLKGYFQPFHRTLLESLYKHYQFLTAEIENFQERVAQQMAPYAAQIELLATIPCVDRMVAWHLIAELGADMTVFPDADHCASWAGLVPGENESAGQRKSTRCRKATVFSARADAVRLGGIPLQDELPARFLSPPESQARLGQSHRRHRAQDTAHRLQRTSSQCAVSGTRPRLLRPAQSSPHRKPTHPPAGGPRSSGSDFPVAAAALKRLIR